MIAVDLDKLKGEIADLKATIQTPSWDYVTGYISALSVAEGMIATLPTLTLDDLRPKGRWERKEDGKVYCSVCQKKALEVKKGVWHIPNFCNHCGADMRGGGEDG